MMFKGFREFIVRGNVVDLAVGIIIGAAFTGIVTALVTGIFNPLIGLLFKTDSLSNLLILTIATDDPAKPAKVLFGAAIAAVIQFLLVALVVYFAIVLPINRLRKINFRKSKAEDTVTAVDVPPTETELLIQIRDLLAERPSAASVQTIPSTPGAHAAH